MNINSKIAFVGDTHFGRKAEHATIKRHIKRGQMEYFKWLRDDLVSKGIKVIFFTGDIFDTRNAINVEALVETYRIFKTLLSDFDIHVVIGNHDMYYEDSYDITPLELFNDLSNVTIYRDSITKIKVFDSKTIHMVPWIINDNVGEFHQYLDSISDDKDNNILFGHFEMIGVDMEGGNISTFGLQPKAFTDSAYLTISGHYHGKSALTANGSTIQYLGSPYPLTFANTDADHGYWVMDEECKLEFFLNTVSPSFTTLYDTNDLSELGDLSNSFVRLYINNSKSKDAIFAIRSLIEAKKPLMINVIPYKDGSMNEQNKSASQKDANKLLNMDLFALSEIYIQSNEDSLPTLKTFNDSKKAIMDKVKSLNEQLTFKK